MTAPDDADVRRVLADAAAELSAAGIASPRVDAELLLAARLGRRRSALLTGAGVPADQLTAYSDDVRRRAAREPLQHITGTAPFRHVELAVGPGVFVPRPETELLVDAVLDQLRATPDPVAVDLCSGSGALAVALADEVPGARVLAVELSADARPWLERNAGGTGVEVVAGDVRDPALLTGWTGRVDAVVSNPPYVPSATPVAPEVGFDPEAAVFAGLDGLDLIPDVIACAARLLRTGGRLALEHDETHQDQVLAALERSGQWRHTAGHPDLTGRPRFVTAERR